MTEYSNPRMHAEVGNWPLGSNLRGMAVFDVEIKPGKGERAMRVTRRDDAHKLSKPKVLTYARKVRIVDGDDGRIYIIALSSSFPMITVMRGTMDYMAEDAIIPPNPRYDGLLALFA